jgi:tripartite-type tricarboxylate transporter receptor subunit TctC
VYLCVALHSIEGEEMNRTLRSLATWLFVFSGLLSTFALAQPYPSRPIKIVAAAGAGSGIDVTFRTLSEEMQKILGQPLVVENKVGANGLIAIQDVVRSKPDGYTLLGGNINSNSLMPVVDSKKLTMDVHASLLPVMYVNHVPAVLVASTNVPVNLAGFIETVRKSPGKVNYGVTGIGAYNHMDTLVLSKAAGLKMEPIVTPTVAAATTSLLNGDIQMIFITAQAAISLVQEGKIRAIAVTGNQRLASLPNVPTMSEAGYPGIGSNVWQGLFAPAGTPKEAVDRVFQAVRQALAVKSVDEAFKKAMFVSQPSASPEEFRAFLKRDHDKWMGIAIENDLLK